MMSVPNIAVKRAGIQSCPWEPRAHCNEDPVSQTALPEADASKNLPLQAQELGCYSLPGHTAIRASVAPNGIARGRAVAPVLAMRIQRSLMPDAKEIGARAVVVGELPTPGPLGRRCVNDQTNRLRVQGRDGRPASSYEGV